MNTTERIHDGSAVAFFRSTANGNSEPAKSRFVTTTDASASDAEQAKTRLYPLRLGLVLCGVSASSMILLMVVVTYYVLSPETSTAVAKGGDLPFLRPAARETSAD